MRKEVLLAGVLACTLGLPLVGCGGTPAASTGDDSAQEQTSSFDAIEAYWGQWRGSVDVTGNTIYGNTAAKEQMLDIDLAQDGTCAVTPLEDHEDLLSDQGTWEGTETEIILHLEGAGDISLTVLDRATCEADASLFGIADFDTIQFDFYG